MAMVMMAKPMTMMKEDSDGCPGFHGVFAQVALV
jgi:hypothetical protein